MSQAIGNIVYGIPCTYEMRKKAVELGLASDAWGTSRREYEALGFTVAYHPSTDMPIWCGVLLDSVSDCNDVRFAKIRHEPTDAQRDDVRAKIAALPAALRALAGDPDVWFIWSGG